MPRLGAVLGVLTLSVVAGYAVLTFCLLAIGVVLVGSWRGLRRRVGRPTDRGRHAVRPQGVEDLFPTRPLRRTDG